MDPGEHSSPTPGRNINFFDAAALLGHSPFSAVAVSGAAPYAHLAHIPSAFSFLGRPPAFPAIPPFGGLGGLPDGLGSPLQSPVSASLSPTTGGADWWRLASEHARRVAGSSTGVDYFAGSFGAMGATLSPYAGLGPLSDASAASFDALFRHSQAQKSLNGAFGGVMLQPPFSSTSVSSPGRSSSPSKTVSSSSGKCRSSPSKTPVPTSSHSSSSKSHKSESVATSLSLSLDSETKTSVAITTATSTVTTVTTTTLSHLRHPSVGGGISSHSHKNKKTPEDSQCSTVTSIPKSVITSSKPLPLNLPTEEHNTPKKGERSSESDVSSASSLSSDSEAEGLSSDQDMPKSQPNKTKQKDSSWMKPSQPDATPVDDNQPINMVKKTESKAAEHKSEQIPISYASMAELISVVSKQQNKNHSKERIPPQLSIPSGHSLSLLSDAPSLLSHKSHIPSLQVPAITVPRGRVRGRGRGRGRGRARGTSRPVSITEKEMEEQRLRQEQLKIQLEAQLKQQQMQLKIAKKAQALKEKEAAMKALNLKTGTDSTATNHVSSPTRKIQQSSGTVTKNSTATTASEPLVAKFKTISGTGSESDSFDSDDSDSGSESEDESSSVSDSDSGSEISDVKRSPKNMDTNGRAASHRTDKRSAETSEEVTPRKRRRTADLKLVKIPLTLGWRRQTKIRTMGPRGIVGEVTYFAPCGKKLRTYPDVLRYLEKNEIRDLGREFFSFSTRVPVGEFLEATHDGENGFLALNDEEIAARLMTVQARKLKLLEKQERKRERKRQAQEMARLAAEARAKRKMEQQELNRRAAEYKLRKKFEKQQQIEATKQAKQMRAIEIKRMKEQQQLLKQQEKMRKREQIRTEREMRAQQLTEARRRKKEQLLNLKIAESVERAKERELKRQQAVVMKEQERERRRQHLLLVKALEARKKQDEKERLKEEKKNEKTMHRQRKLEQKRMELEWARELKKPMEDMQITDLKPLPTINRIPGVRLAGQAFADCLMVLEFLHNFGDVLGFDTDSLPNLNDLQVALLGEDDDFSELISLTSHLLSFSLEDPGIPNVKETSTFLGQKLTDIELTDSNISEVLRRYIWGRNGKEDEMTNWLKERPLQSLDPTKKAAVLAFLCNELLSSKNITSEIEKNIENISNLRRDKWIVEGKLRKLKAVQLKQNQQTESKPTTNNSVNGHDEDSLSVRASTTASKRGSEDEDEIGNESGHESDEAHATGPVSEQEEEPAVNPEELEKKIERLNKQHNQYRKKVVNTSNKLRAMCFGQDRYRRRYWVLPRSGGIFVEGLESAEPEELTDDKVESKDTEMEDVSKNINKESEDVKTETTNKEDDEKANGDDVEMKEKVNKDVVIKEETVNCDVEMKEEKLNGDVEMKEEKMNGNEKVLKEEKEVKAEPLEFIEASGNLSWSEKKERKHSSQSTDSKPDSAIVPETTKSFAFKEPYNTSLLLQRQSSSYKLSDYLSPSAKVEPVVSNGRTTPETFNSTHEKNSVISKIGHCKDTPAPTPNFMSIDSLLSKDSPKSSHTNIFSNNFFLPNMVSSPMSAEQMLKNLSSRVASSASNKPSLYGEEEWFSILPRMPCDETSLTRSHSVNDSSVSSPNTVLKKDSSSHSAFLSPVPPYSSPSSFQMHGSQFPSFQMSQLTGSPMDYSVQSMSQCSTPTLFTSMMTSQQDISCGMSTKSDDLKPEESLLADIQEPEPQPIPAAMKRGWWRITDQAVLKELIECLHVRGVRERNLQKTFQKYEEYACQHCTNPSKHVKLEVTDESKAVINGPTGAPESNLTDPALDDIIFSMEKTLLGEVENLEERICTASLQVKGWKLPAKVSEDEDVELVPSSVRILKENQRHPLVEVRAKLLTLERNIEKRYLKPPLAKSHSQINLANMSGVNTSNEGGESDQEEEKEKDVPHGLRLWRNTVESAVSVSQLTMCLLQLNNSVAWEKSIMKVNCQICCHDDNEAELLLCDSCDKGYHTYCFKPKMETIPDGDWYCYECISKATGEKCCVVCGKKTAKLVECDHCPRSYHLDCLNPPLPRAPRRWKCPTCSTVKSKSKSKKKKSQPQESKEKPETESEAPPTTVPPNVDKQSKGYPAKEDNDLSICRVLLLEMEKHDAAWPFLAPVNCKKFPSYKKIIKHPMDFSTMSKKLRDSVYKSCTEFANDARLVFDNCQTFNEDDSEVGESGHTMRKFFETRWAELCSNSS